MRRDAERAEIAARVILSKVRDPRLVTIRRGGTLTDTDHQLLALWAAQCARASGGHAMGAARSLDGAARYAAYAAGQAACVGHVPEHYLGAAAYAIRAARAAHPRDHSAGRVERDWQRDRLDGQIRGLVIADQARRNAICWSVFED